MSRLAMTMFFNVVTRTQIRAWTAYIALSDFATSLPSEDLETCSLSVSREKRKQTCPDAKVRIIDSINVLPRTRENILPTDLRSDKNVVATTCLKRFPLSFVYDQHEREVIENKWFLSCRIETAIERVVCLICTCWLAIRVLSLKSRRRVSWCGVL